MFTNTRRRFIQYMALAGVGSRTLFQTGDAKAALFEAKESVGLGGPWPEMTYRKLGKTGFNGSRLVFGCGAALFGFQPANASLQGFGDSGVGTNH